MSKGDYDKSDNFAVTIQPALTTLTLPNLPGVRVGGGSVPDLSYLSANCLYPSQKMHALSKMYTHVLLRRKNYYSFHFSVAKHVWNNLFEFDDGKSHFEPPSDEEDGIPLVCPSYPRPFLKTYDNSKTRSPFVPSTRSKAATTTTKRPFVAKRRAHYSEEQLCDLI